MPSASYRLVRDGHEIQTLSDLFAVPVAVSPAGAQHERGVSLAAINFFLALLEEQQHGASDTETVMKEVVHPATKPTASSAFDCLHGVTVLGPPPTEVRSKPTYFGNPNPTLTRTRTRTLTRTRT